MSGTVTGGKKAGQTNKELYGEDFYRRIGAIGGTKNGTGGFHARPELASSAGRKGGLKSRRTGVKNGQGKRRHPVQAEEVHYIKQSLWDSIKGRIKHGGA